MSSSSSSSSSSVSHHDLARLANVTQSTVSRALDSSRCHLISSPVRERIITLAQELGYQPNIHARRTRSQCSEALTLVIDDILAGSRVFYDFSSPNTQVSFEQINGIIDGADEYGFDIKFLPLTYRHTTDSELLSSRIGFPYSDGVIFIGFHYMCKLTDVIAKKNLPMILLLHDLSGYPCYQFDLVPGYRQMLHELKRRGRRRIAFCGITKPPPTLQNFRYQGLCKALAAEGELGLEVAPSIMVSSILDIRREVESLCRDSRGIDALVCYSDPLALHIHRELLYLDAQSRFSVVGYAGEPQMQEIASIALPRYELCRSATRSLIQSLRDKTPLPAHTTYLPATFRVGNSL